MKNALQIFTYNNNEVRTVERNGDIWFVAKDVCDVLGLGNVTEALRNLDDDELTSEILNSGGQGREMRLMSESGVYALVLRSNKPEAKAFSRWVRHEVLPQIRKTGQFSIKQEQPALPSGVLDGARLIFETAGIKDNQLTLALDKVYKSYTGRSALQSGEVDLIAPSKSQLLTPTQIGSAFGLNARRVNEILAGAGLQHKINDMWEPLEPGLKFAVMVDAGKKHSDGTPIRQLKWDSSILETFRKLI